MIADMQRSKAIIEIIPNIRPFMKRLNLLILYLLTILFIIASIPELAAVYMPLPIKRFKSRNGSIISKKNFMNITN